MPHPFYNFFVSLAGSGLAQGGPGAKESALAPELGCGRAEPGRGITSRGPERVLLVAEIDLSFIVKRFGREMGDQGRRKPLEWVDEETRALVLHGIRDGGVMTRQGAVCE